MNKLPIAFVIATFAFVGSMFCSASSPIFIVMVTAYVTAMAIVIGSGIQKHYSKGEN